MLTIILITKWNKREGLFKSGIRASHGKIPGKSLDSSVGKFSASEREIFHGKDGRLRGVGWVPEQKSQSC